MTRASRNYAGFAIGIAVVLVIALMMDAGATTTPSPVGSAANASSSAGSISAAHSDATAVSGAVSGSVSGASVGNTTANGGAGGDAASVATGGSSTARVGDVVSSSGDSSATGGNATQSQTANGGSASNAGNSQATNISYKSVRNAPSIAQGSLMPSGCGAAGNAGGSAPNGSGFLGIAFTTDECYRFMLSQSFAAIGMPDTACDVLLTTKAAKRAFNGRNMPDCTTAENRDAVASVVVIDNDPSLKDTPSKAEVNESIDRAFRRSHAK